MARGPATLPVGTAIGGSGAHLIPAVMRPSAPRPSFASGSASPVAARLASAPPTTLLDAWLLRRERTHWVDRVAWPYGVLLLGLGALLELTVF